MHPTPRLARKVSLRSVCVCLCVSLYAQELDYVGFRLSREFFPPFFFSRGKAGKSMGRAARRRVWSSIVEGARAGWLRRAIYVGGSETSLIRELDSFQLIEPREHARCVCV